MGYSVELYNFDTNVYQYIGRVRVKKKQGIFCIEIPKKLYLLSYTHHYILKPDVTFLRRHENENLSITEFNQNTKSVIIKDSMNVVF